MKRIEVDPNQLELRPPLQRGGLMTDFDWRLAESSWKMFFPDSIDGNSIKNSRIALQLSTNEMARRLGIKTSVYCGFEKRELAGKISLESMRRIADAMDCDFVYKIVPKSKESFSMEVWDTILTEAQAILKKRMPSSNVKGLVLASIAKDLFRKGNFRRIRGWSERKNSLTVDDVQNSHSDHHD